jgi:type VI secretion system FHA domain protein
MLLTLEVTGPQGAALGAAGRKVFNAAGGTIGRLPDNAWALPDPYVSSRHAVIRFRDGTFYIEDTSTNGVSINSPDNPLAKGQPYALKSGDWIFIEPYEIRASIADDAPKAASPLEDLFGSSAPSVAARRSDPLVSGDPFSDPFAPPPPPPRRDPPRPPGVLPTADLIPGGEEVDPLSLLGFEPKRPAPNAPNAADLANRSVLSDHYQAPAVPAPASPPAAGGGDLIPDDYDPLDERPSSVPRPAPAASKRAADAPRPVARAAPPDVPAPAPAGRSAAGAAASSAPPPRAADSGGDLAAVLAGAGLDHVAVTPELARSFGRILRVVVAGVMDILQARQRIKSEFRMGVTSFKPADNNPLKFSANVDDALHNLLVKRNTAYLGPVDAFEDAFGDIRHHQMAMLAGVRVAFEAMLAEFDPDRLQAEFDRQLKKGALLSVPARLRYWDLYREKFHDMVKDPETTFRELFGEEFAKAYEEQLRRLRAQGRADKA